MKLHILMFALITPTLVMTASKRNPELLKKLQDKKKTFKANRSLKNSSHSAALPTGEKVRKATDAATAELTPEQMATISTEDMVALIRKNLPNNGVAAEQNIRDVARLIKNRAEATVADNAIRRATLGHSTLGN